MKNINTKFVVEKTPVSFANKSKICGKTLTTKKANARTNQRIESSRATCDFLILRVIEKIVTTATRTRIILMAVDKPELIIALSFSEKLNKQD